MSAGLRPTRHPANEGTHLASRHGRDGSYLEPTDQRAAYNPDQPRVPAGSPDGGQWTGAFGDGGGLSALDEVGGATETERIEVAADGHHFVPRAIFGREPLQPDARRIFENEKTGRLLGGSHFYDHAHIRYNQAVKEKFDQFLSERGIRAQDMSASQAREFAASIRSSTDPRIRDFNLRIFRREFLYLIRRYRIRD